MPTELLQQATKAVEARNVPKLFTERIDSLPNQVTEQFAARRTGEIKTYTRPNTEIIDEATPLYPHIVKPELYGREVEITVERKQLEVQQIEAAERIHFEVGIYQQDENILRLEVERRQLEMVRKAQGENTPLSPREQSIVDALAFREKIAGLVQQADAEGVQLYREIAAATDAAMSGEDRYDASKWQKTAYGIFRERIAGELKKYGGKDVVHEAEVKDVAETINTSLTQGVLLENLAMMSGDCAYKVMGGGYNERRSDNPKGASGSAVLEDFASLYKIAQGKGAGDQLLEVLKQGIKLNTASNVVSELDSVVSSSNRETMRAVITAAEHKAKETGVGIDESQIPSGLKKLRDEVLAEIERVREREALDAALYREVVAQREVRAQTPQPNE